MYSDADATARHVRQADRAIALDGNDPRDTYLGIEKILAAAKESGAEAIHPGYGFLSENAEFARRVEANGLVFIGPTPACIEQMGDKINARNLMAAVGVPVGMGTSEPVADIESALVAARLIGFPVMVKAAGGGGGIGMGVAPDEAALVDVFATTMSRAKQAFGSASILLERYVPVARHVEVQIFGLADGRVLALGERDCSVQRRHQKLAEETPAPGLDL